MFCSLLFGIFVYVINKIHWCVKVCAVHANCYPLLHGRPSVVYRTLVVIDPIAIYSSRIGFLPNPPASTFPFSGFPSEHCHNVRNGKTTMVWLRLFVSQNTRTWRCDRHRARRRHNPRLCIASRGKDKVRIASSAFLCFHLANRHHNKPLIRRRITKLSGAYDIKKTQTAKTEQ